MKILSLLLLLMACSKSGKNVEVGEELGVEAEEEVFTSCVEEFSFKRTKFKMTGYKFQDQTPVHGTFKEWTLEAPQDFKNIVRLLSQAKFSFKEASLDFGKIARNKNILNALLSKIPGETITGSVESVDSSKKVAKVRLSWGGMQHIVPMEYKYESGLLTLKGRIDIIAMGFDEAFSLLESTCRAYHTKNGVSKTWNFVDIEVTSRLKGKDCE